MSAVADVLNGAADLIERVGWVQGFNEMGARRCLVQAIHDVSGGRVEAQRAISRLVNVVGMGPRSFNDTPGRTKDQVVAALRAAAERAA